jgi:DNA-binding ferritin-like protein (Dps family)
MNIWETMTGSDLTRGWKVLDARAAALPSDYQAVWAQIKTELFAYGSLTGRNLTPIADSALGLLEETASEGRAVHEVFGDDIKGFCAALAGGEGARSYRDRCREQLNRNVANKLNRLGD